LISLKASHDSPQLRSPFDPAKDVVNLAKLEKSQQSRGETICKRRLKLAVAACSSCQRLPKMPQSLPLRRAFCRPQAITHDCSAGTVFTELLP
jgi:hypothetical protein